MLSRISMMLSDWSFWGTVAKFDFYQKRRAADTICCVHFELQYQNVVAKNSSLKLCNSADFV